MRAMCLVAVAAFTLTGCGGGAETHVKDTLAAMNAMTAALKAGDKAGVKKAAEQLKTTAEKMKAAKVSVSEDKRLQEKYEPQLKAATEEMTKAMFEAMGSGKFSPDDMKEIGEVFKNMK